MKEERKVGNELTKKLAKLNKGIADLSQQEAQLQVQNPMYIFLKIICSILFFSSSHKSEKRDMIYYYHCGCLIYLRQLQRKKVKGKN